MIGRMEHRRSPPPQCCSVDDTAEFSLPEGVDLVGLDNNTSTLRKPMTSVQPPSSSASSYQTYNTTRRKGGTPGWKTAVRLLVINLFVCGLVLGYALIGSFVFLALEGNTKSPGSLIQVSASGYPISKKANLTMAIWNTLQGDEFHQLKNDVVKNIWNITLSMNILYQDNWTRLTADEVNSFQRLLMEKVLLVIDMSTPQESAYSWTFPRAFLFALTTLTTIGYGGIGPKTASAKIATIIYAIFGIPIMLWYLSNVGSLLAKMVRYLCTKLCCCCCEDKKRTPVNQQGGGKGKMLPSSSSLSSQRKVSDPYYQMKPADGVLRNSRPDESRAIMSSSHHHHPHHHSNMIGDDDDDRRPLPRISIFLIFTLCIAILIGYVCLGSYIVSRWEQWRFLDSFYFCFLTLTTISFGDIRTQKLGGLERFQQRTEWFCSFYILFGMALTSMFFNILHEEISRRFKRWKDPPLSPESSYPLEDKEALATVNRARAHQRRPIENSYSVHYMNFSPTQTANTTTSRNYTEDSLLPNEMHGGGGTLKHGSSSVGVGGGGGGGGGGMGLGGDLTMKSVYDDDEVTSDYIVSHPIPPPREIYGSHPVFPR